MDPDPGGRKTCGSCGSESGTLLLTPGSWIWDRFFQDPGASTHNSEGFVTIFWVKNSLFLYYDKTTNFFGFGFGIRDKHPGSATLFFHPT
jgi:hypothetical protein